MSLPLPPTDALLIQARALNVGADLFRRALDPVAQRTEPLAPAEVARYRGFVNTLDAYANADQLERSLPTARPAIAYETYRDALVQCHQLQQAIAATPATDDVALVFLRELLDRCVRIHRAARSAIEVHQHLRSTDALAAAAREDAKATTRAFVDPAVPAPTRESLEGELTVLEGVLARADARYRALRTALGPSITLALDTATPQQLFDLEWAWHEIHRTRHRLASRRSLVAHYDEWLERRRRAAGSLDEQLDAGGSIPDAPVPLTDDPLARASSPTSNHPGSRVTR